MRRNLLPYGIKIKNFEFTFFNRYYRTFKEVQNDSLSYKYKIKSKGAKNYLIRFLIKNSIYNTENETGWSFFLYDDSCIPFRKKKYTRNYFEKLENIIEYINKHKIMDPEKLELDNRGS